MGPDHNNIKIALHIEYIVGILFIIIKKYYVYINYMDRRDKIIEFTNHMFKNYDILTRT